MTRYPHTPVPKTYPGSQGWACRCEVPKYKRHVDPPQCVPPAEVDLWRAHYPEAVCSDRIVRTLIYLAKEFHR
jgi:hypothetical protein